jgi:hypothetical protein
VRRLLVLLFVLAACSGEQPASSPSPRQPPLPPASPSPTATASAPSPPPPSPTASPAGTATVAAWFVRTGPGGQRFVEPETHVLDEPTVAVAAAAMRELVAGVTQDRALSTLAPPGTRVLGVDLDDGLLTVDLSGQVGNRPADAGGEETFAQQLAWTGTQFDSVDAVRLLVDGAQISDLWGEVDWSQPVRPDPLAQSPIVIEAPRWGEHVAAGPLELRGTANVFEATVALRLIAPGGRVAEDTFTTATCGSGCRGTFTHRFATPLTPGRWTVEAAASDASGGEGPPPFTTRVEVTAA